MKFVTIILFLSFVSCSNINLINKDQKNYSKNNVIKKQKTKKKKYKKYTSRRKTRQRQRPKSKNIINKNTSKYASLSLTYSKATYKNWLKYFNGRSKKRFSRYMKRGERFKKTISKILRSHGLPEDLYYVGLIESGYKLNSKSHAKAVGPWQFMKKTGIHYGLKVNSRVDERKDIVKSTHAAARYFKDLYNIFGSWELALCGYNAGEFRVIRAIRKGNSRNYISLSSRGLIPKETSNYIPKIAAARQIYHNRLKGIPSYRVKNSKKINKKPIKMHKVKRGDTLYSISRKHKTTVRKIKRLNRIRGSNIYIGQRILLAYAKINRK